MTIAPGTARRIIAETAREHNLSSADLVGPGRLAPVVAARWIAMRRVAEATGWSTPRIGRAFGKDHSTVISAFRRMGFAYRSSEVWGGWNDVPKGPDGKFARAEQ